MKTSKTRQALVKEVVAWLETCADPRAPALLARYKKVLATMEAEDPHLGLPPRVGEEGERADDVGQDGPRDVVVGLKTLTMEGRNG